MKRKINSVNTYSSGNIIKFFNDDYLNLTKNSFKLSVEKISDNKIFSTKN